jgi:hypothetical protein
MEMSRYARHNPLDAGYQSFAEIRQPISTIHARQNAHHRLFFVLSEQGSRHK